MSGRPAIGRRLRAKKQQSSIFSSKISELNQRITNWRVSPVTGQLERRCRFSDGEDPQSRPFVA
ncbi:hypothetical protein LOF14_01450 [Klebsiella variicola subsp. variicola]|nr:hypothetical protein LOF14_01450 [Klebsiella variicola subsp. variicola]